MGKTLGLSTIAGGKIVAPMAGVVPSPCSRRCRKWPCCALIRRALMHCVAESVQSGMRCAWAAPKPTGGRRPPKTSKEEIKNQSPTGSIEVPSESGRAAPPRRAKPAEHKDKTTRGLSTPMPKSPSYLAPRRQTVTGDGSSVTGDGSSVRVWIRHMATVVSLVRRWPNARMATSCTP